MTYQPPYWAPRGVPLPGLSQLPASQEDRLRRSFDNLSSDSKEDLTEQTDDAMDTSLPDEMPPDYGDDDTTDTPLTPQDVSDLSSLPHLTEDAVLGVVKQRYQEDNIFTRCGDVLISVNPFKQLSVFDEEAHETYSLDCLTESPEPEPHLFHVAAQAAARRSRENTNQVILVSGESGAGKTAATKLMLRHILHLTTSKQDRLYEGIDKVNPLIELFGNAETQLNGNSSRFAKFLDVRFTKDGAVNGAIIRDYILEKSRVVSPSERESNFHIFYTFLDDVMRSPTRQQLFLMEGMNKYTDFRIVPQSSWRRTENRKSIQENRMSIQEQARVFQHINVGSDEVENMHVVLAAILHLTNIRFEEDDGSAGGVMVENEDTMSKAAALLNVDPERLARVLVTRKTMFSGAEIEMFKSQAKAEETRDAMAKALYERLFGWLVRTINIALNRNSWSEATIGFLDICGFEDLKQNSLEQLCINLANEHLQSFMNTQVFQAEMKVYQQEGISLGDVRPPSNEAILSMFDAPKKGILALINEDTRLEISTGETMVHKLCQMHGQSQPFLRYKNDEPCFGIRHFAAPVWYDAHQFLEKNGDDLNKEVKDLLVTSSNELVSDIFQVEKAPTGSISPTNFNYRVSQKHPINFHHPGEMRLSESVMKGLQQSLHVKFKGHIPSVKEAGRSKLSDQRTVIDCFQTSMKELLDKMKKAHALFVRCIKPNDHQVPDQFEDQKVLKQLHYNGVTEIARIRKFWFAVRLPFSDFIVRYCNLSPEAKTIADKKEAVTLILRRVGATTPDLFKIGKKVVFLKEQVAANLDKELERQKEEERRKKEEEQRKNRQEAQRRKEEAEAKKRQEQQRKLGSVVNITLKKSVRGTPLDTVQEASSEGGTSSADDSVSTSTTSTQQSISNSTTTITIKNNNHKDGEGGVGESAGASSSQAPQEEEIDTSDKFWDIFRIVAREQDRTDIHHLTAMKIIKFIAYIFIFTIVLATSTCQRVSLMIVTSATRHTNGSKEAQAVSSAYYILMMVAICIPYLFTFLLSLAKVAFGGFTNPSPGTWIWVFFTESLHTLGLTLLVFRVLPRLDVLHGLLFLSAVGVIPSVLKLITSVDVRNKPRGPRRRVLRGIVGGFLDILAFAGQVSVFPAIYVMDYVTTDSDGIKTVLDVAGAMLVSVACWENFMDGRFFVHLGETNPIKNFLLRRRYDLERGRYIPQLVFSVWKIALTTVLAYVFRGHGHFDYEKALDTLGQFPNQWKMITAIVVLTISAAVCYYFAYIACKLWMQRLSFVLPLTLSTPCAIVVFLLDHQYHFLTTVTTSQSVGDLMVMWPKDALSHWRNLVMGGAWFLSLLLLTRHVWWPRQNRLAKFEMLFMNPLYCGILTMETLFMNRRRHTLSCRKKRNNNTYIYRLDKSEKRSSEGHSDYVDETYAEIRASAETYDPENPYMVYGGRDANREGHEEVPMIYACATMWHEVRREMVALLKSLHRIDLEQWTRKQAQEMSGTKDPDYFEYEAHIFFDDAMTLDDDEEFIANDYVKMVVEVMEEAVSSVYKKTMTVSPPIKIPTPYGGQLLWIMPGDNLLFVHLKDKTKIRHRKRWSQVMYMYYLLGFRLTRQCQQQIIEALKSGRDENTGWSVDRSDVVGSDIFEMLDEKVAKKSQNTFVMALDGDTDFSPGSVHILLDRMKKNPKVAAACGRIHPIGSGPLVWYQMFEYAIGHWMQKATEHVLGCVLCSPGCFSLFRGSALMDDNVMRKYAILPTEPGHFLQYDQGEDRWLCTLLLQQGYRVDYAAAADAWTYAPEGFNEFFNQRRRWMPSTLANIMDLLADYSNTVTVNSNISMLYIIYQVALMVATLLGPGTVLMMIAGAIGQVFTVDLVWSYVITMVPAIIYLGVCIKCKSNIQLYLAALLSTFYSFVMMIVFVGVVVTAAQKSVFHPSVLVIIFLVVIFLIAGLCHPMEIYCLPSGALYLLCIPSGYLLLVIYSICNLHVVSWGTREAPKKKTKAEIEQEKEEAAKKEEEKAKKKGFFSRFFFSSYLNDLKELIQSAAGQQNKAVPQEDKTLLLLQQINDNLQKLTDGKTKGGAVCGGGGGSGGQEKASNVGVEQVKIAVEPLKPATASAGKEKVKKTVKIAPEPVKEKPPRNQLENPKWIEDPQLGEGEIMKLFEEEMDFWKAFVKRYLAPLESDKEKEKELGKQLIELRNQVCFGFSMINLLWMAINFMFQFTEAVSVTLPVDGGLKVGILGLLFVFFLLAILLLQIFGMILHRWGTLLHLLAFTDIDLPCFSKKLGSMRSQNEKDFRRAFDFCRKIISEPIPDYLEEDAPLGASVKQVAEDYLKKSLMGTSFGVGRQSVVQSLNRSGILNTDFVNSRQFDLYLRGTARVPDDDVEDDDVEDEEASKFVTDFRSNIHERKHRFTRNGYPSTSPPRSPRGDGFAPAPPRRQNSGHNLGVRRRINANNLRYTARNTIQRYQRDSGQVIPPGRREADRFGGGGGGFGRGGEMGGGGVMDRAFSKRLHLFSDYSRRTGNEYDRGGVWGV